VVKEEIMLRTLIWLLFLSSTAAAAETKLNGAEITLVLNDVVLNGEDHGRPINQIFQKSGATFFNSAGGQSQGAWNVQGDQYCSQWPPNPSWACYDIMRDGAKVTFVAKSGTRTEMSLAK
jgi:hypothetical protein